MTVIIHNKNDTKCGIAACCATFVDALVEHRIIGTASPSSLELGYIWEFNLCANGLIGKDKLRFCPYCGEKIGNGRPIGENNGNE